MNKDINAVFRRTMCIQYALYYGVLGIFLPYFNLYCFNLGFSGFQIGLLSAVRSLILITFSILWGIAADRFGARKPLFIFCSWASAVLWLLYLDQSDYGMFFAVTVICMIFFAPLISFMEAFTMDVLSPAKQTYGRIRGWGTISFILIVTLAGWMTDRYNMKFIIVSIFAGLLAQALFSFRMPSLPRLRNTENGFGAGTVFLRQRHMVVFLFCNFLMLVSHGTYYGFFSIHLERLGCDRAFIGMAWALAAGAESLVMFGGNRIFRKISIENALVFSFVMATLRWLILYATKSPALILISQVLHAFTFGLFHIAGILYMDRHAPAGAKTMGQAVNNAIPYGLGMLIGFLLNGWLFEPVGAFNLFLVSSFIAMTGGLVLKIFYMTESGSRRASVRESGSL